MKINNDFFENVDMEEIESVLMSNNKYSHFVKENFRKEQLKEKKHQKQQARKKSPHHEKSL